MITNDYKNGYNNHKPAHCATSKREKSRAEMFLVDTVVGLTWRLNHCSTNCGLGYNNILRGLSNEQR
jgi:hypothetical protein